MKDVQFVGAMGPPGGARNSVDPRFISLFNVFEIQFPATESLTRIFNTILNAHIQNLTPDIKVGTTGPVRVNDMSREHIQDGSLFPYFFTVLLARVRLLHMINNPPG
jgi:hypothetical protein